MNGGSRTVLVVHPGGELFGSDRMMLETVTGLTGAGHRVEVLLPDPGPLVAALEVVGARVTIAPVLVLRKSLLKPRGWPRLLSLALRGGITGWRLLRRRRPDVVYVSTITLPQWPLLARLAGARAITHVHEAESSAPRLVTTGLSLPHLAATAVVVNSEVTRRTLASALPRLARRAEVIHNGVASPEDPPPPRPAIDGALRVLYVGRLSPRKGPDLVIEAAARLQEDGIEVRVALLGAVFPGYEWFERELRAQADASGVPVDFLGFDPDVWPALAAADVLVVPSRGDEFLREHGAGGGPGAAPRDPQRPPRPARGRRRVRHHPGGPRRRSRRARRRPRRSPCTLVGAVGGPRRQPGAGPGPPRPPALPGAHRGGRHRGHPPPGRGGRRGRDRCL